MKKVIGVLVFLLIPATAIFPGKKKAGKKTNIAQMTNDLTGLSLNPAAISIAAQNVAVTAVSQKEKIKACKKFCSMLCDINRDLNPLWAVALSFFDSDLEDVLIKNLGHLAEDARSIDIFARGLFTTLPSPISLEASYADVDVQGVVSVEQINSIASSQLSLLEFLSYSGRVRVLEWFFHHGLRHLSEIDCVSFISNLSNAVYVSIVYGHLDVLQWFEQRFSQQLQLLLTDGGPKKQPWLQVAIECKHGDIAAWLSGHNVAFEAVNVYGSSPLMLALYNNDITTTDLILPRINSFNIEIVNTDEWNLWHCAAYGMKNEACMNRVFAKVPTSSSFSNAAIIHSLTRPNKKGHLPLQLAVQNNNVEFIRALAVFVKDRRLNADALVHASDTQYPFPAMFQAIIKTKTSKAVFDALCSIGGSLDARLNNNATILHMAVIQGKIIAVQALVELQEDLIDLIDNNGYTSLEVARLICKAKLSDLNKAGEAGIDGSDVEYLLEEEKFGKTIASVASAIADATKSSSALIAEYEQYKRIADYLFEIGFQRNERRVAALAAQVEEKKDIV